MKGIENIAADALSRRVDFQLKNLCRKIPNLSENIFHAQGQDNFTKMMKAKLKDHDMKAEPYIEKSYRNFEMHEGVLAWKGSGNLRSFVPNVEGLRKEIVLEFHKTAHLGSAKIYASVTEFLYWKKYVRRHQEMVCWM